METRSSIFPALRTWPPALNDVEKASLDSSSLRLVTGAGHIEKLPSYKHLKALWCSGIDQSDLTSICQCTSLDSLYLENIKTADLRCLKNLSNLRTLGLESCSKITTLQSLAELEALGGLAIIHFKNVHDLGPLADLVSLRALAVAGSMWTRMQVDTLAPLAELRNLEFLHLTNLHASDESLRPIAKLQNLKLLETANFYPMREFAWLSQKLANTECTWFRPYVEMKHRPCAKCEQQTMVMLTGKRKPILCRQCDRRRLENHIREWNEATQTGA